VTPDIAPAGEGPHVAAPPVVQLVDVPANVLQGARDVVKRALDQPRGPPLLFVDETIFARKCSFLGRRRDAAGDVETLADGPAQQIEAVCRRQVFAGHVLDQRNVLDQVENRDPVREFAAKRRFDAFAGGHSVAG